MADAAPAAEAAPTADAALEGLVPGASGLLRVMTCGSVDDGKSSLIGRLLHDTDAVAHDHLEQLAADSRQFGTTAGLDLALLVDGLEAERAQGITIDLAYRFFSTARRRFVLADAPGHEQYTRNMVTAASSADLAVVLVDARHGVVAQTLRHAFVADLLGVRHLILAVNKMDLVGYDAAPFRAIVADFTARMAGAGFASIAAVPVCATRGCNVTTASAAMPWYHGPPLLELLEAAPLATAGAAGFCMPVQAVCRADAAFRGYAGTVAAGCVSPGQRVSAATSGQSAQVARIVTMDGDLPQACAGDAVTLVLDRPLDLSRGDVLMADGALPPAADQFGACLIWLATAPLMPGRSYWLKLGTQTVGASVSRIRHVVDVTTRQKLHAASLGLNDVAKVHLALDAPVAWARYADNRTLGGFILIDRQSCATSGVGMIDYALTRSANVRWHDQDVDREARAGLKGQRPVVLWFTGLSGAGKSTIANLVERRLHGLGRHTYLLDGDNLRHGLNRDLGFTEADRVENIRRASEVAALMADAGLITLVALISPYRAEREAARQRVPAGDFLEIFVDTPLAACIARDVKGLYRKALAGEIGNFTGVSAPYEPPLAPDLHLRTADGPAALLAQRVVDALRERGVA